MQKERGGQITVTMSEKLQGDDIIDLKELASYTTGKLIFQYVKIKFSHLVDNVTSKSQRPLNKNPNQA